jgi:hypothetical protein
MYTFKDQKKVYFSHKAKNDFLNATVDCKDSILMDMLGELGFNCGKTRWDSPILFTHIDSREIVIAVKCPTKFDGWDGCPYPTTPGRTFAFFHEQSYEIRILGEATEPVRLIKSIPPTKDNLHWLSLPNYIRQAWSES